MEGHESTVDESHLDLDGVDTREGDDFQIHGGELQPIGGCLVDGRWRRATVKGDNCYQRRIVEVGLARAEREEHGDWVGEAINQGIVDVGQPGHDT